MTTKFNLGDRIRDTITKIEGVAVSYCFHLNGCQHVEIEPDPIDGKPADAVYLSEERFELVIAAANPKTASIADCHIKLGNEVQDTLSGFKGHATIIMIPLFGVGRIAIEPKLDKDGKLPDSVFFDEQRVKVITAKAPPVVAEMPPARNTRGAAPAKASAKMMGRTR